MGGVKSRSKKRDIAAAAAARRFVDGGVVGMAKGKGGSKLSFNSAISEAFLPVRIAIFSLILFLGVVAAFLYSRQGSFSFFSLLAPAGGSLDTETIHVYGYEIVHEFPHDPAAFTQGLFYDGNGTFYESTGLYGKSSVRMVDVATGKVLQNQWMNHSLFGEGLTLWDSRLLQVSWRTTKGIIYDKNTLTPVGSFDHPMQDGWGLTTDGKHIIGSDGTANLYFMDPLTFKDFPFSCLHLPLGGNKAVGSHDWQLVTAVDDEVDEVRNIMVQDEGRPVRALNELEYIGNKIWSNVYMKECIAQISPKDGKVTGWLLMHGLRSALQGAGFTGINVLNGIAWDNRTSRLFVTGKLWPKVYEIRLIDRTHDPNTNMEKVRKSCIW